MTRVSLRRGTADDAECLSVLRTEPSAARYQPLRSYSLARLRAILRARASMSLDASLEGKVQWVVLADGQCAGWITLDVTSREHNTGAVGYTVGEAWRGRGIATEAVRQVVGLAFDQRGIALDRLEAVVAAENFASRRVLEKAGLTEEGTARGLLVIGGERVDHVRYGRLRGDRQDMPAGDGRVSYATGDGCRCSPRRRPPHHPHDADRVP